MENISIMKLIKKYIWHNRYVVLSFFAFCAVFAFIFVLYDISLEAILYAFFLCALIEGVIGCVRFYFYYSRHIQLVRISKQPFLLLEELPEPDNLIEYDYQEILKEANRLHKKDYTEWQSERNESIDYYTAWVHQIKTPISVMRLILQEEDTEEHQELMLQLFRIEQYVDMVLSYFRLTSSSSDFVFKKYSIDKIIKRIIRKYAGQFIRKRIRLNYQGTDMMALTDEKWLEFMLEQILSNAVKYTEAGEVTIQAKDNTILISDTGIGIAPEDLPRIFERGFTGYNGRSDKKSTGLGLYLCKKTADKLNVKVNVFSEVGKGTTFKINLERRKLELE